MKRHIFAVLAFFTYCGLAAVPGEWLWFAPETPIFADAEQGQTPAMAYSRTIRRQTSISYTVVVRSVTTGDISCESKSGPFDYLRARGPVIGQDLAWWAPADPRCQSLPPGTYWVETTWLIVHPLGDLLPAWLAMPFGWIVPPKQVRRESPPFTIFPLSPDATPP